MDDFWSDLRARVGSVGSDLREFYSDNKGLFHSLITGAVTTLFPEAASILTPLTSSVLKRYGGRLQSEDPYAIDVDYIKYVFHGGPASPAPRTESHYMYQMSSVL